MRLKPVLTEKSMKLAENGVYTFFVDKGLTKDQIKSLVNTTFTVHVTRVRTIKVPGESKKTIRGYKKVTQPRKKALVNLQEKEKIDLFEVKSKKSK
jgi:large subunit ribosomal protein L23